MNTRLTHSECVDCTALTPDAVLDERGRCGCVARDKVRAMTDTDLDAQIGSEVGVDIDQLRFALANSSRWAELICGMNLVALARAGRLRVEDWTFGECKEVFLWIRGEIYPPPVITEYLDKIRGES